MPITSQHLILVRSDSGDGAWSLHAPDATDAEIADGTAPALASGEGRWDEDAGAWAPPPLVDVAAAMAIVAADHA